MEHSHVNRSTSFRSEIFLIIFIVQTLLGPQFAVCSANKWRWEDSFAASL